MGSQKKLAHNPLITIMQSYREKKSKHVMASQTKQTLVQAYAMQDANQPADWPLHITSLASYLPSPETSFDSPIPKLHSFITHSDKNI